MKRGERGSALLLAILAIAALGAGLMGALAMSSVERRAVLDQLARSEALVVAESGLDRFVGERVALGFSALLPAAYESTRINVPGGYADVILERLRAPVSGSAGVYAIRSRGIAGSVQLTGVPAATRTVSVLARWQSGNAHIMAAFTGLSGIDKSGSSGAISGNDVCGATGAVAGVAVPNGGYDQSSGKSVPAGSPAIKSLGSTSAAADSVRIDWAGIVDGTALTPDIAIPGAGWPSFSNPNYWPIIRVTGNLTLPSTGRGTLIVTGSLTIGTNNRHWNGVILVGDRLIASRNTTIQGAVIAGLNRTLGQSPPSSTISSGNKNFRYSSCNVASALDRFGGLVVLADTWSDNWATW